MLFSVHFPGLTSGLCLGSNKATGVGTGVAAPFCLSVQSTTVARLVKGFCLRNCVLADGGRGTGNEKSSAWPRWLILFVLLGSGYVAIAGVLCAQNRLLDQVLLATQPVPGTKLLAEPSTEPRSMLRTSGSGATCVRGREKVSQASASQQGFKVHTCIVKTICIIKHNVCPIIDSNR